MSLDGGYMDDELGQFRIAVYELCLAAALGELRVEIHSESGERRVGVPTLLEEPGPDWPGDGASAVIEVDHTPVVVEHIARCTIFAPSR